jgi:hypothetical protein
MDLHDARATDLTDSVGASRILSERFGKPYSVDSVQQLVKQNRLRAFLFADGVLTERTPGLHTRGKDLLFLRADLYALERPQRPGRPVAKP